MKFLLIHRNSLLFGQYKFLTSNIMISSVKFSRKDPANFFKTIRERVNNYFEEKGIEKTGNWELYSKSVTMFLLYFLPYALVLTPWVTHPILIILCYMVMGLGCAGIGLTIMHDANHGAYSNKPWLNKLMSSSMDIIGASSFTWHIQHNVLHHSFTNIYQMDEDIDDKPFLRLSPSGELKGYHRFQHFYALLLYSFATLSWVVKKDWAQLLSYNRSGMTEKCGFSPKKEWLKMIAWKTSYFAYVLLIPILLNKAWWAIIIGWVLMHMIAGLMITVIFQLAHVVEGPDHFDIPEHGNMDNTWAIHQLKSTANFACSSRFVTWFTGGLNHQIEHHLFPSISHIHYRKISKIVKETAKEFNLPYYEFKRVRWAIMSHLKVLKLLGRGLALS